MANLKLKNDRSALENYIKIMNNRDHYYCTGDYTKTEEKEECAAYNKLFEANAKSYKKGQKILIIHTDYAEKITRKNLFQNVHRTHSIIEVTVHQPAKTRTRNMCAEEFKDVVIKYATKTHIHTVSVGGLLSVAI